MTPVLRIEQLSVSITGLEARFLVLDGVSLEIMPGDVMGLVGESGCGKSTVVKSILGVLPRGGRVDKGSILFQGTDLVKLGQGRLTREIRGRRIAFIPQDPALALNPLFTVRTQLRDLYRRNSPDADAAGRRWKAAADARSLELLRLVQIPDAEASLDRYPHQFSGGQRQRVLIAAALIGRPELVIADEPTTALDVTTQQQVLALLDDLARRLGLSVLFVTHDFGVVSQLCNKVTVMYAGQTMEVGAKQAVLGQPSHPYSRALIDCHPDRQQVLAGIPGMVPSLAVPPPGCRFHPRCTLAIAACAARPPHLVTSGPGQAASCIRYDGKAA